MLPGKGRRGETHSAGEEGGRDELIAAGAAHS